MHFLMRKYKIVLFVKDSAFCCFLNGTSFTGNMREAVVEKLSPRIYRRLEDRKAWDAYWKVTPYHFLFLI